MTPEQRRAQARAVIIQYGQMVRDGMLPRLHENLDQSRYLWASEVLCRLISTLGTVHNFELNVLRDVLNGKPPKVHQRLRDVLDATKKDSDQWANWMMHNAPAFARYRDPARRYTVETLPLIEAFRMLKQEEARGPYRKSEWKPLQKSFEF